MSVATTMILIHGGMHDHRCWRPTIDALAELAPGQEVLAVDLPGRGRVGGNVMDTTVESSIAAVLDQIDRHGAQSVVLVGHSAAGLILPGVAYELGARVSAAVLVACSVPRPGRRIVDNLRGPIRWAALAAAFGRKPQTFPDMFASAMFCNGMTAEQRRYTLERLVPETPRLSTLRPEHTSLPSHVDTTWVLPMRDRSLQPRAQRRTIAQLGIERVVELDSCHDAMIHRPDELAAILLASLPDDSP